MQLYRRASVRQSVLQLIFRCAIFCQTLQVVLLGRFQWPMDNRIINSLPTEELSVCHQLPSISQIFRLGDFLLLKPSANERYASSFLLIDWQKGHLYGKPVSRKELFGFDHNGDDPDGQLLFASTLNLCQLWSSSSQRMKRDSRQLSDTEDVEPYEVSEDEDALAVNQLESKLSGIQGEIKQLREKATIKEEHSQIKQQLASLNGQLQILLGSLLSKSTTASPVTTEKMTTSSKTMKMARTQSTATTTGVPIVNIHDELHQEMRQLFLNLSQIAADVNVKLSQLKASGNINIAMKASSTPKIFTTAGTISTSTLATSQGTERHSEPLESRNCPNVILATFVHSHRSWESLLCSNEMYGSNSWLKSLLFKYQSDSNGPNLSALSMDRQMLQYRGVIQVGRRFTSVHPELSCSVEKSLMGNDDIFGGFTIEDRVFLQNKYGRIWEKGQLDNSTKMSINRFLRDVCTGNSPVSRKPLKLIGKALWLPETPEKTNSWKRPSSERLIGRRKKMNRRMMHTKRSRLFDVSKTEEETFDVTEGSDISESKWNRNNDNVNGEWHDKQTTTSAAIIRNTTLNVLTTHQASLLNASNSMNTNNSRLQGQLDRADKYSNALSQAKDRSVEDQEKVDKPKDSFIERNTTQEWSFKSLGLAGLTLVIILGLAIAAFLFFARNRKTIPEEASEEDENDDEGRNKKKQKKRKVSQDGNDKKQRKHKKRQSNDGESMDALQKESMVEEKDRRKHKRAKKQHPNQEHQEVKTQHRDSSYQINQMPAIVQQGRTTAEPKVTETESTAATRVLSVSETPKVTVHQMFAAEEQPAISQKSRGLMPSQDEVDLHEVVLIDPENVLQFCGQDTQMANRIEMMFGESKVIAQLMDMKRRETPKKTATGGRKSTASQTCISKEDDDLKQEGSKAESAIVKIDIKKSLGQGPAVLPKEAKEYPEAPLCDPKGASTPTSPKSPRSKPTLLYKPNDETIRPFIEVLHRMKKTLKKRSKRRQAVRQT